MKHKRILRALTLATLVVASSLSANAQDLLARQAPVDRRTSSVDTMMLRTIEEREDLSNPASDLYPTWDNRYAHRASPMPDVYKIDLRGFHMPTPSRVITSNFGRRWGRRHQGLDIKVYIGDTIRAAFSGKVRVASYEARGYGNYIVIRHNNGLETIYGHMSKRLVRPNQVVRAGQPIGLGGNTGRSTGSHLHFETRLCGKALNPALFFDFPHQDVTGDFYVYRSSSYERESARATAVRGKSASPGYSRYNIQGIGSPSASAGHEPRTMKVTTKSGKDILYHKVIAGETLESIARMRGISVEELCRMNHISRNTRLSRGQILRYS